MNVQRPAERGSIFVYILIAIVVLAALCYAVANGGGGSVSALAENGNHLTATSLIDYSDSIGKSVARLRLRGTAATALSFAHQDLPADYGTYGTAPANEIFNPSGGGIIYKRAPEEATASGAEDWLFLSGNAIKGIGTSCDDNESCADLVMALPNVKKAVCDELNKMLGVGADTVDPSFDTSDLFAGAYESAPKLIGNTGPGDSLANQGEACLTISSSNYVYYKVLLAR
jgi:hypothetical protein